ncbi:MAG: hypothetical protein LIO40_05565, partial [Ruminococcus sp.]|nr:hypothetical protein [Ruminococcus sp.]
MPETTTNLGLTKPLETELYDVGVFNANADIIDSSITSLDGHLEYMQNLTNSLQDYLFSSPETTDLRGSEFDFSAKRGFMRKAYLYDSTTAFTDAPSLPEVSDGEIGEFYFEAGMSGSAVEDAVDARYTQLVACTDSGPVYVRDGEYGSWSDWREVTAYALSGEAADLTAINKSITELQTADAELRVKIGSDYSTLYSLIEELQSADETLTSSIASVSSSEQTHYNTLSSQISGNYETLSATITSNYNELSGSISTLSDKEA